MFRSDELYARYGNILWEDGKHKYNVSAFIAEINEILSSAEFSIFTQEMLDGVIGTLRGRGNSNATINRKMAALGKLLRKASKMGDIHSLPEFRRQKERAGRIRFLDVAEEDRLFEAIATSLQRISSPFSLSRRYGCQVGRSDWTALE